jgi:hypothetical protein
MDNHYFEWRDAVDATARQLAALFIERFPQIAARGQGRDWTYAGWFTEMLGVAERGYLPMAFNDWSDLSDAPALPTTSADGIPDPPNLPLPPLPASAGL